MAGTKRLGRPLSRRDSRSALRAGELDCHLSLRQYRHRGPQGGAVARVVLPPDAQPMAENLYMVTYRPRSGDKLKT